MPLALFFFFQGYVDKNQVNWWTDAVPMIRCLTVVMLVEGWRVRMPFHCLFLLVAICASFNGVGSAFTWPIFLISYRQHQRANDLAFWWIRRNKRSIEAEETVQVVQTEKRNGQSKEGLEERIPDLPFASESAAVHPLRIELTDSCKNQEPISVPLRTSKPVLLSDSASARSSVSSSRRSTPASSSTVAGAVSRPPVVAQSRESAVAEAIAHEPVSENGGVDLAVIQHAVQEYFERGGTSDGLALDLLAHPSPVNSRPLPKLSLWGINMPLEALVVAWYFNGGIIGFYGWLIHSTRKV
jgi:hypothetical protein